MVQDLYPDLAIHLGYSSPHGIMSVVMYGLNHVGFAAARKIVVLGEGMRRHFATNPHYRQWVNKVIIIPNWEDPEQVFPVDKDNAWSRLAGYDHGFTVLYAGNIGLIQNLDPILEAARILNGNIKSNGDKNQIGTQDITFLFAGEGGRKIYIQKKAADMGLDNVRFITYVPTENYNDLLATADCGIVALKPGMDSFGFPVGLTVIWPPAGPSWPSRRKIMSYTAW